MRWVLPLCLFACSASSTSTKKSAPPDPVWRERVANVFTTLTTKGLHPGDPQRLLDAAWTTLGENPRDRSIEALSTRIATGVATQELVPANAWQLMRVMTDAVDDAHTMLLAPEGAALFEASVAGNPFTAPGLVVHRTGDKLVVSEVLAGGPAATAGVAVGDVIVSIDKAAPLRSWAVRVITFVPESTLATLAIERDGKPQQLVLRLTTWNHPVVRHEVRGSTGIVRPYFFSISKDTARNTLELTRAALTEFDRAKVTGIVLDLRGNQGGMGVNAYASLFTNADPILIAHKPGDGDPFPWPNVKNAWPTRRKVAVLVDEQAVSAAEMVALALHEHAGARLFGQPTGNALNVPNPVELGDGYLLFLPEVPVFAPNKPATPRVDPDETIPNRTVADLLAKKDAQLDAALRWLE